MLSLEERRVVTVEVAGAVVELVDVVAVVVVATGVQEQIGKSNF